MDNGKVLLGTEFAKMTCWQDSKKLSWIHGLHVTVLSEAIAAKLVGVEERGEASVHVESLVVKPLEDFPGYVGFKGILGMVSRDNGCG